MLIYLDVETTRFFQDPEIKQLPRSRQLAELARYVGVAVTYDAERGYRTWWPDQVADLWATLRGHQIAGWNVISFDVPLIQQAVALAGVPDPGLDPWTALDLFAECRTRTGRWYKLEEIAQANLGRGKVSDGQQASLWLRSGDPVFVQRAADYCKDDVALVRELHLLAEGFGLLLPARGRDPTPEVYRLWIRNNGASWRLVDEDTGQMLDQEGWDAETAGPARAATSG